MEAYDIYCKINAIQNVHDDTILVLKLIYSNVISIYLHLVVSPTVSKPG